jgi:hypothetical protein
MQSFFCCASDVVGIIKLQAPRRARFRLLCGAKAWSLRGLVSNKTTIGLRGRPAQRRSSAVDIDKASTSGLGTSVAFHIHRADRDSKPTETEEPIAIDERGHGQVQVESRN